MTKDPQLTEQDGRKVLRCECGLPCGELTRDGLSYYVWHRGERHSITLSADKLEALAAELRRVAAIRQTAGIRIMVDKRIPDGVIALVGGGKVVAAKL